MNSILVLTVVVVLQFDGVVGHGRLIEPASRNAMWRFKYKNPRNYNDMGLNCGGFTTQFEKYGGKCGVCGDSWSGEREHEAGGKYANGIIARQYKVGSFINITVTLTSNHMGYFEFRLCPVNNPRKKATQACLDRHLLNIAGHGTRYFIMDKRGYVNIQLFVMLPPNLSCAQCVLQWKYNAGQSMGPDGHGGECLGCGNQENFINCADIAIGDRVIAPLPQPVTTTTSSPPVTKPPQAQNPYQVLAIGMLPNGAIPTVHASYGAYNHVDPPSAVAYNAMPIPQPPTAHSSHSQVHIQSGKVQDWSGNQHNQHSNTHQPAQVAYTTIQETQPQSANNIRPKVQIIQKPNPYAKHQTQSQTHLAQRSQPQQKHFSPQPPNGPAAPAHAYHQAHIKPKPAHQVAHYPQYGTHVPKERSYPKPQASSYPHSNGHFNQPNSHVPQTNSHAPQPSSHLHHPNHHVPQPNNHVPQPNSHVPQPNIHMPQANSHVPQTSSSVQHLVHMQAVSYVPHANNHVVQATSHVQPNSHATQQQTYVPQGPTYPQQAVHAPQPPAPTYQQPHNPVHTPHHLQSKTYAPAAPAPPAKPSTNVATQTKTSNPMQIDLKSIKAMFPQLAESFDWMNEVATPPNQNSADPSQGSYPGYEPGEYPEPGESPPQQRPSSSNEQSSSYMQGYNDAMRALKQQFGISETTNEAGSSSTGKRCPGGMKPTCKGINQWQGQPQFDSWCTTTCSAGECPANFCSCTCPGVGTFKSGPNCRGVDPSKGSSMDEWCTLNCKGGHCPPDLCVCL